METLFEQLLQRSSYRDDFLNNKPLPKKYYKFPLCRVLEDLIPTEELKVENKSYDWSKGAVRQLTELNGNTSKSFDLSLVTPNKNKKIWDWMHSWYLKNPIGQIHNQQPGQTHLFHMDVIESYNKYTSDPIEKKNKVKRVFIFLEDWSPGQVITLGTKIITGWTKGDVLWFDWYHVPHGTANFSRKSRLMIQLTGETTPEFEELLKK